MATAAFSTPLRDPIARDTERRTEVRRAVRWTTAWSDGRRVGQGEILDVCAQGLFLSSALDPANSPQPGDTLELRCGMNDGAVDLLGEVCWSGRSNGHDRDGIGLRIFTTDTLMRLLWGVAAA